MTNVLSVWIYCLSLGEQYLYYPVRGGNKAGIQKSSPSRAWKTLWSVQTCSRSHSVQVLWIKPVIQTGSTLINTEKSHNKNKSLNQGLHWGLVDWPCRKGGGRGGWVSEACTSGTCCRARGRRLWTGSRPASGPAPTPYLQRQEHRTVYWTGGSVSCQTVIGLQSSHYHSIVCKPTFNVHSALSLSLSVGVYVVTASQAALLELSNHFCWYRPTVNTDELASLKHHLSSHSTLKACVSKDSFSELFHSRQMLPIAIRRKWTKHAAVFITVIKLQQKSFNMGCFSMSCCHSPAHQWVQCHRIT